MTAVTRFASRTVIITGSSAGIGLGIARRFGGEGANVVLNSRSIADCELVAKEFDPARTLVVAGDVSSSTFCAEIIAKTVATFGGLDVLVNNAGVARSGSLVAASDDEIDTVIDINVKGVIYLSRAAIPHLAKSTAPGGGSIINISSVSGIGGDSVLPIYNASKGAVCNFTRGLALQLGPQGIRVNAVLPSLTRSEMSGSIIGNEALMKLFLQRMPLGRVAEPDDIAGPVLFLASEDARFVTGVNLAVDGGVSASNGQPNLIG